MTCQPWSPPCVTCVTSRGRSSCTSSPKRAKASPRRKSTRSATTPSLSSTPWMPRPLLQKNHRAEVFGRVRRMAVRHGRSRSTPGRDHSGDEGRLRPGRLQRTFPPALFDVAIAEQHAVTFAAGMACEGAKPVVAIYSTFLQRGYDQLIHDVGVQNSSPVRHGSGRPGRRRRSDPCRQLRPVIPALHPRHAGDDAERRKRAAPDAQHWPPVLRAGGGTLSTWQWSEGEHRPRPGTDRNRQGRGASQGRQGRHAGVRRAAD